MFSVIVLFFWMHMTTVNICNETTSVIDDEEHMMMNVMMENVYIYII